MDALHDKLFLEVAHSSELPLKILFFWGKLLLLVLAFEEPIVLGEPYRLRIFGINVEIEAFNKNCILQQRIQAANGNLLL